MLGAPRTRPVATRLVACDGVRRAMTTTDDRGVALYHVVRTHEGFEDSVRALFRLLRQGQDAEARPAVDALMLFLDIEGHRQADGRLIFVTDARLHLDLHVRPLHADRVARDALWRGGLQHGAGLDVVDGPMPRARHLLAGHLALTERAAAVRASVVDGVEAPLQVEEGDLLPSNFDALRRARGEVGSVRDLSELRHMDLLATRRDSSTVAGALV